MFLEHVFVYVLPFSLPLGVRGLAAACDCGPPWTILLTFFYEMGISRNKSLTTFMSIPIAYYYVEAGYENDAIFM